MASEKQDAGTACHKCSVSQRLFPLHLEAFMQKGIQGTGWEGRDLSQRLCSGCRHPGAQELGTATQVQPMT